MAILNTGIPTNLTEYPNSFKRQTPSPLEAYSIFYSLLEAQDYSINNPIAYVGQIITVIIDDRVKSYKIINESGDLIELIDKTAITWKDFEGNDIEGGNN